MQAVLIIPARYGSTRLPGKPLAEIHGKALIVRVLEQALLATRFSQVLVATDDTRIADAVENAGGTPIMTSPEHQSGTDRIAEVAAGLPVDIIVNLQGDEPFVDPLDLDSVADALAKDRVAEMATLRQQIVNERDFYDPNVVKVVTDDRDYALYFSRAPIPYHRSGNFAGAFKHVGVYAYRKEFLLSFAAHRKTVLEDREGLEQLRALTMGARIKVVTAKSRSIGIDTPEDLLHADERARKMSVGTSGFAAVGGTLSVFGAANAATVLAS